MKRTIEGGREEEKGGGGGGGRKGNVSMHVNNQKIDAQANSRRTVRYPTRVSTYVIPFNFGMTVRTALSTSTSLLDNLNSICSLINDDP